MCTFVDFNRLLQIQFQLDKCWIIKTSQKLQSNNESEFISESMHVTDGAYTQEINVSQYCLCNIISQRTRKSETTLSVKQIQMKNRLGWYSTNTRHSYNATLCPKQCELRN